MANEVTSNSVTRSGNQLRQDAIRACLMGVDDIQKVRVSTGNRICASFNKALGQAPGEKQEEMSDEAKHLLEKLLKEYKLITDAYADKQHGQPQSIKKIIEVLNSDPQSGIKYIKDIVDYELIDSYNKLQASENIQNKLLAKEVHKHPLWDAFFVNVKGCGETMAAWCLAYLNIEEARHVSSFWKYCGLDTVHVVDAEGNMHDEGRGRKHAGMNKVKYIDKDGIEKEKASLGYNPKLKSKLCGVLMDCFKRNGVMKVKDANGNEVSIAKPNYKYTGIYFDYKARLQQRPDLKDYSKGHIDAMAKRYAIKQFLRDLWVVWREMEGLEVSEPYEVAKLGNKPHKYNEAHEEAYLRTKRA